MKLFKCQCCGQILHFENTKCLRCGHNVGYLAAEDEIRAVEPDGELWSLALPQGGADGDARYRFCRNWEMSGCNWLIAADSTEGDFCEACAHNRTVPDLSNPDHHARWQKIETAKRRLIYTLRHLGLPLPTVNSDHPEPLIFDFMADDPDGGPRVLTGHANGVVTISLTEADDAEREAMKAEMGEAYRTLLGHFRHEIGHYYWDILVRDGGHLDAFRNLFGDEREDYSQAMETHYQNGPPEGWENEVVSAYATMHAWEDWAETWAHYMHMVDTLETAISLGITIDPEIEDGETLSTDLDFNPYRAQSVRELVASWTPLTVALNTLNRAMGESDLYPFAFPPPVKAKLAFIHDLVKASRPQ